MNTLLNWLYVVSSLTGSIIIFSLYQYGRATDISEKKDSYYPLLFFSIGFFLEFFFGLLELSHSNVYPFFPRGLDYLSFILATTFTTYPLNANATQQKKIRIAFISMFLASTILSTVSFYFDIGYSSAELFDFIFFLFSLSILAYYMLNFFYSKTTIALSSYALITIVLFLFPDPYLSRLIHLDPSQLFVQLMFIYSHLSLVFLLCFLSLEMIHSPVKKMYQIYKADLAELKITNEKTLLEKDLLARSQKEDVWQEIAFKAAHKLGNPLDAIDTYLQSLITRVNKLDYTSIGEIAKDIDESVEEAKHVLSAFKSLTKLNEISYERYDVSRLIKDACKTAQKQSVEVTINNLQIPDSSSTKIDNLPVEIIDIDKKQIKDCFSELVANSLHFFKSHGEKKISVQISQVFGDPKLGLDTNIRYVKILFSDNGSGIENKNKKKIFTPFFSTFQDGAGLGLSIVNKIIELHNGIIYEEGIYGEGAKFLIFLPTVKKMA